MGISGLKKKSTKPDICSVGQLFAETMGRPGGFFPFIHSFKDFKDLMVMFGGEVFIGFRVKLFVRELFVGFCQIISGVEYDHC